MIAEHAREFKVDQMEVCREAATPTGAARVGPLNLRAVGG